MSNLCDKCKQPMTLHRQTTSGKIECPEPRYIITDWQGVHKLMFPAVAFCMALALLLRFVLYVEAQKEQEQAPYTPSETEAR